MKMRKTMQMIRKKLTSGLVLCAVCALIAASLSGCGNSSGSGSSVEPEEESLDASYRDVDSGFGVSNNVVGYDYNYDNATNSVSSTSASSGSTLSSAGSSEDDTSQKLIRTVNMNLETTKFDDLTLDLEECVEEMGGYVESINESISSGESGKRWANMTIRIPEERLDEFLDMVGESANVTYIGESVEDVTLTYVDLDTHIEELRLEQKTMENLLDDAETIEEVIAIQGQLTEIRYELESYESQLKILENRVSYSTVYLYINEVERETPAASATFGERVQARFSDSINWLRDGLRSFAVGFLGYFPIIILAAVIVAAALLILWGCIHRNRKLKGHPTRAMRRKQLQEVREEEKIKEEEEKNAEKALEAAGESGAAEGPAMIEKKPEGSPDGEPGGQPGQDPDGGPGGRPGQDPDGETGDRSGEGSEAGSEDLTGENPDGQPGEEPDGKKQPESPDAQPGENGEEQPGEGQAIEGQAKEGQTEPSGERPEDKPSESSEEQSGDKPLGDEPPGDEPPELSEEEVRRRAEEEFTERWYNPNGPYA